MEDFCAVCEARMFESREVPAVAMNHSAGERLCETCAEDAEDHACVVEWDVPRA